MGEANRLRVLAGPVIAKRENEVDKIVDAID